MRVKLNNPEYRGTSRSGQSRHTAFKKEGARDHQGMTLIVSGMIRSANITKEIAEISRNDLSLINLRVTNKVVRFSWETTPVD